MSQSIHISTTQNVNISYEPAGIGSRILAAIIDYIIIIAVLTICSLLIEKIRGANAIFAVLGLFFLLYDLIFELAMSGATPGKLVLGIKVIKLDGSKPDLASYLIRWVFRIFDGISFGGAVAVYSILFTDRSQRIGDLLAGTTVIRVNTKLKLKDTILVDRNKDYKIVFPQVQLLTSKDVETIKAVKDLAIKDENDELARVCAARIKQVLNITSDLPAIKFLKLIIFDFNHLDENGLANTTVAAVQNTETKSVDSITDFMPKYETESYQLENATEDLNSLEYDEFKPKIDKLYNPDNTADPIQ